MIRFLSSGDIRRTEGFTLIELLVAMTLFAMLMTALFGGLRLGTRVWEVNSLRLEQDGPIQSVRSFLRQRLEEASPVVDTAEGATDQIAFNGGHESLHFASSMPMSVEEGIFFLELSLHQRGDDDRSKDLILRWRVWPRTSADGVRERVILKDVSSLNIAYFGANDNEKERVWNDTWANANLPELVRIGLSFPHGDHRQWSPLIVSPMIDDWYNTGDW